MADQDQYLALPGGRTLAYATAGNAESPDVVIFFHGVFGVGSAPRMLQQPLVDRGVHYIAPTLSGWGKSSSPLPSVSFHECLYQDVTALITHLHPHTNDLKLYIAGGSYGTVPAQMLYGASYDAFPLGRHIAGLLLLVPFSPFRHHKEYTQCLTWPNWVGIGPPSQLIPFKLIPRVVARALKSKVGTPAGAEAFIRDFAFTKLTPAEREAFERYKAKNGFEEGQVEKQFADGIYRSIQKGWDGYIVVSDVLHSDWGGYSPGTLDEEHGKKPVLISLANKDPETAKMGEWIASQLPNASVRYEEGGHIAPLFVIDDIWADFMARCD